MCDLYNNGCGGVPQPMFTVTPYLALTSTPEAGTGTGTGAIVSLAEAKQQCRVDINDDDGLIQTYIDAAISYVSGRTGSSLGLTKHVVEYHQFPADGKPIVLPVQGIDLTKFADTKIRYVTKAGGFTTIELGDGFDVAVSAKPQSVIYPTSNPAMWPSDALSSTDSTPPGPGYHISPTVTYFTSPSASQKTPAEAKVATLMLVAHWYTAREPVTTGLSATNSKVPYTVDILLASSSDNITF